MYYKIKKNKFKYMTLILFVFLVMGSLCIKNVRAEALDLDIVTFAEPKLEAAVREKLKKPTGDITVGDMESMTADILLAAEQRGFPNSTLLDSSP